MFDIQFVKSIKKDLKSIPLSEISKIKHDIHQLKNFPNIIDIKRLVKHPIAEYRLRIGNYRVLFDVDNKNNTIIILKIGHRKDVY